MARLIRDLVGEVLHEAPRRPITETFVYEHVLDFGDIERMSRDDEYIGYLKRDAATQLASYIIEKCQLFQIPDIGRLCRGVPIRMELTIDDRGTYENWLSSACTKARTEGVEVGAKRVRNSIPYGFELDQYYE